VAAALQIWSPTFSKAFDSLPASVRENVQRKIDEMGARLESFPHKRLEGRPESSCGSAIIACFTNSM
jgi:mRNA-degrading endonuclease RelE of RelBE toxin-antitoxin system